MYIVSCILFALSANMDNLPIGIAYGMKNIHIRLRSNALIACLTSTGTFLSMKIGGLLAALIPTGITACLGSLILISLGFWFVGKSVYQNEKRREIEEKEQDLEDETSQLGITKVIGLKESLVLATALTVNNMGFGIGARIAGLSAIVTTGCTFICSMALLAAGLIIGKKCSSHFLGNNAELFSGLLIIGLGVYELFW